MKIIRNLAGLEFFRRSRTGVGGLEVGLVMTMGALHDGHRSLISRARRENSVLVVSIFVNPRQFGPAEDLSRYPRPLEADLALCRIEGVDRVFVPDVQQLYPSGYGTSVVPGPTLTQGFEGAIRPGHFSGVATVVTKVLNLIRPTRAYFGQKDAQQVAVIRSVARDLHLDSEIVVCPTVRDPDSLALSSRNIYLQSGERQVALALPRALGRAVALYRQGTVESMRIESTVRGALAEEPRFEVEYVAVVDPDQFIPIDHVPDRGQALVVAAGRVGGTRLLDNVVLGRPEVPRPIIAIDGPAGAGKSTIARRLARRLGFLYLDTGAMYRAVTWKALQKDIDPGDGDSLGDLTRDIAIRLAPGYQAAFPTRVWVDGFEVTRMVRSEAVTRAVSAVSSHPSVRQELVEQQRLLARMGGVILDGRDIGTHVFPEAELKIFLTASIPVRAARRADDLLAKGLPVPEQQVLEAQIRQRDEQDSSRACAPLRQADDAIEVNTDHLTIPETIERLLGLYRERVEATISS